MRKRTLRTLLKASIPVNFVLLALMLIDHFAWENAGIVALFIVYGLFLVWLIILLVLHGSAPYRRIDPAVERTSVIVYPRNHG